MISIVVLGTDAVLRARPASAVQFAHACIAAGYDAAVPASWGDELVAERCLRELKARATPVNVFCACTRVQERLTEVGEDLAPLLLTLPAPPVALARYLRAVHRDRTLRITFVGDCLAAEDPAIDARYAPEDFVGMLIARGISISAQPTAFEGIIPPDRRRYYSLPGGVPSPEMLWSNGGGSLLHFVDEEFSAELAQRLLTDERALVDLGPLLGCSCSGLTMQTTPLNARAAVSALEPPRATGPILEAPPSDDVILTIMTQRERQPVHSPEFGNALVPSNEADAARD